MREMKEPERIARLISIGDQLAINKFLLDCCPLNKEKVLPVLFAFKALYKFLKSKEIIGDTLVKAFKMIAAHKSERSDYTVLGGLLTLISLYKTSDCAECVCLVFENSYERTFILESMLAHRFVLQSVSDCINLDKPTLVKCNDCNGSGVQNHKHINCKDGCQKGLDICLTCRGTTEHEAF